MRAERAGGQAWLGAALGSSVLILSTCLGAEAVRDSAAVQLIGRAERCAGLFLGFSKGVDDRWLALPPGTARQIEFIADSGSTGYGDLSTTVDCTDDELAARSDASQSYAIVAAHQLHAHWQLNAMDGIGVVRNWHGIWTRTSYATYASLTLQTDSTSLYRDVDWHPQVAVVRIGANDLGSPLGADEPWTPAALWSEFPDAAADRLRFPPQRC